MSPSYYDNRISLAAQKILREHFNISKDKNVTFSITEDIYLPFLWRIFANINNQNFVLALYDIKQPEDAVIKQIYSNDLADARKDKKRRVFADGISERYAWFIVPQS